MHILALQAYDATSHRALLRGWRQHSRHTFEVLSLPARNFKWRMRQAPVELARQVQALALQGRSWDALWCTSMLDLAAFRGLCPATAHLPAVVYFHENQLTYPARHADQRDVHFGLTNTTSALAAIASNNTTRAEQPPPCVWWNSAYNRDCFLDALDELLQGMPDYPMPGAVDAIRRASAVHYPGIEPIERADDARATNAQQNSAPTILWAARWEYDKGPAQFFEAIDRLVQRGIDFRLSVIGEQFAEAPECFAQAKARFADRIVRWGYQPTRAAYEQALREADLIVSTSRHEFFGIAVAEAVGAGCRPVLPKALAYPEVWAEHAVYHDNSAAGTADAIERAIAMRDQNDVSHAAERFAWSRVAPLMDDAMAALSSTA